MVVIGIYNKLMKVHIITQKENLTFIRSILERI